MEDGIDTKDIVREYAELKKQYSQLQKQFATFKVEPKSNGEIWKTKLKEVR